MITILAQKSKIVTTDELNQTFKHVGVKATAAPDGDFVEIEVSRDNDEGVAELLARKAGFEILD